MIARRIRGHETELPLEQLRLAAERLPRREDSLLDRLFALECLTRAGRPASPAAATLLSARRAAERYVSESWEVDVPHLAVLAQAMSTIDAADEDAPREWAQLLDDGLLEVVGRRARFGLTSDPLLLAAVVRGLAVAELHVPPQVVDAAREYIGGKPTAAGAAELADAFARHRKGVEVASTAAVATFAATPEPAAVIAQYWLAERWRELHGDQVPVSTEAVAATRTQILAVSTPDDPRLAAMLAEIAARSINSLVVMPADTLARLRVGVRMRVFAEMYLWRALAIGVAGALAIINLGTITAHVWKWVGAKKPPSASVLRAIAGIVVYVAATLIVLAIDAAYRRSGRTVPPALAKLEWIIGGVAGAVAGALYS